MSRRVARAFFSRRRAGVGRASFKAMATRLRRTPRLHKRRRFKRGFDRTAGAFRFSNSRELKFKDTDQTDAIVSASGAILSDTLIIAQGTTDSTRIGRQITLKSIGFKWSIKLPSSTTLTSTADTVRVMLILDKQCNGAAFAVTDILKTADLLSFNELNNKHRFRTLMDREYTLTASGIGGGETTNDSGEDIIYDSFFKKVNLPIEYSSSTGAITEKRSNNIMCLVISTDGICAFDGKIRYRYADN